MIERVNESKETCRDLKEKMNRTSDEIEDFKHDI
jgi:hypothetical protein